MLGHYAATPSVCQSAYKTWPITIKNQVSEIIKIYGAFQLTMMAKVS